MRRFAERKFDYTFRGDLKMSERKKTCGVCGKHSDDFICESCKSSIQSEAAGKKSEAEKKVKVSGDLAERRSRRR